MIIDYSTSRPPISLLKSAGVTAVGRYIGWDSVPGFNSIGKNITKAEADSLLSAGISIFLAFEYTPDAASHGTNQGTADGKLAKTQLAELDAPPDMASYFAVDFDLPDYAPALPDVAANAMEKLGPVGQYFKAINALRNAYEIGAYGGYYAIKRLFDAGLITKGWQTVAWSGGKLDPRAVLYQVVSPVPIPGGDPDIREHATTEPDFGQWPRPKVAPPTHQAAPITQEDQMGQLNKMAFLPFKAGSRKGVMLYRDFASSTDECHIRVAIHSASKGYFVMNIVINTSAPVTVNFSETDVDAVSLVLESGNAPVGYALI